MTQFIGGAAATLGYIEPDDQRINPIPLAIHHPMDRIVPRPGFARDVGGWVTPYWPGAAGFAGDYAADIGMLSAVWHRPIARIAQGEASRVGFVGVARDRYGAPLAGVTCSLFLTATRAWIMDVISGADGSFLLQSRYSPDTHFIVFYKAGAPAVYGTTDQILVGA